MRPVRGSVYSSVSGCPASAAWVDPFALPELEVDEVVRERDVDLVEWVLPEVVHGGQPGLLPVAQSDGS
jgi:hypothetical protein